MLRSLAGGARHVDTDGNRSHHDERIFTLARRFREELIMLSDAIMMNALTMMQELITRMLDLYKYVNKLVASEVVISH